MNEEKVKNESVTEKSSEKNSNNRENNGRKNDRRNNNRRPRRNNNFSKQKSDLEETVNTYKEYKNSKKNEIINHIEIGAI